MSSILVSVKTGLSLSLTFVPKLVLVALGLVSANAVALYLPYLAWRIWFPKQKIAGGLWSTADAEAATICFLYGLLITFIESITILGTPDHLTRMSWVMRVGHLAGLALGLGLGLGLVALVIGGCAKLIDMGVTSAKKAPNAN
jgi:hypothetical protein